MPIPPERKREHTESVCAADHTYGIFVGGSLDGENTREPTGYAPFGKACELNRFVRLENVGDKILVNPWIVVNGRRNWRSLAGILGEILTDGMSEEEKARAIWDFARKHRYHFTCADDEVKDTVRMLNVYGYTLCWDEAYTVSNLWQAAGLKVRRGLPHGHCTTEVWFDDAYHLLDSDEHLLYLLRDNRTVASEADLARDHDLVRRGHSYGILKEEDRAREEGAAGIFVHDGPRAGGRTPIEGHEMQLRLRPGESLQWEWESRGKYHGWSGPPPLSANGRMDYRPLQAPAMAGQWAEGWENLKATQHPDGRVALELAEPGTEGIAAYRISSPYVMVGGTLSLHASLEVESDHVVVELSVDGQTWERCVGIDGPADGPTSVALDRFFSPSGPACYAYLLRLRLTSGATSPGTAIKDLAIHTDLQMAPLSLPALEVGDNRIRFICDGPDAVRARVTHAWGERDAGAPPEPSVQPIHPVDDAHVEGTRIGFTWPATSGAVDYHFQLGEFEDMRYCLSPVFEKLMSRTPARGRPEWQIPVEGLLNPDTRYYWRVRARNGEGLWGPWSSAWSFVPDAPAVPVSVRTEPNWATRTVTLRWDAGQDGTPLVCYEVYGSDERGFTASREPYRVVTGNSRTSAFPANYIGKVAASEMVVAGSGLDPALSGFAYYRVVAVDARGARSGPSDYAEAPRPMILSTPPAETVAGHPCAYQIRVIRSIGDLRCESAGSERYISAFRDGDLLRYLLDEAPPWVAIDEETGGLTACPTHKDVGTHTITIRVQNGQGGVDVQGFDLRVLANPADPVS